MSTLCKCREEKVPCKCIWSYLFLLHEFHYHFCFRSISCSSTCNYYNVPYVLAWLVSFPHLNKQFHYLSKVSNLCKCRDDYFRCQLSWLHPSPLHLFEPLKCLRGISNTTKRRDDRVPRHFICCNSFFCHFVEQAHCFIGVPSFS